MDSLREELPTEDEDERAPLPFVFALFGLKMKIPSVAGPNSSVLKAIGGNLHNTLLSRASCAR